MSAKKLEEVVEFHGHLCPGLALGFRVSEFALKELGHRSEDEEIVAIVENDSCAVDAVQVMTGCTFGKGNLIFNDFGKQVYTFIKRPSGDAIRISVEWKSAHESPLEKKMWQRYADGDRSSDVIEAVHKRKNKKTEIILKAKESELFKVQRLTINPPHEAHIYKSIPCKLCGEKVMESRARVKDGKIVCIPCFEKAD